MAAHGTTTVEAKSGYGLDFDSELKSLEAIRAAAQQWPGTVVPTFLGAHAVPPEYRGRSQEYVDLVCKEMMPAVAKRKLAQFADVFCDRGAFSAEESEQIFRAAQATWPSAACTHGTTQRDAARAVPALQSRLARSHGLRERCGSARTRGERNGRNFRSGSELFSRPLTYPNARQFIEAGVAVALATDYNPGSSPTLSMPMAMSLACTHMKMSPAESLRRRRSMERGRCGWPIAKAVSNRAKMPTWRCLM